MSNVLSEDINALNGMTTEHIGILSEAFLNLMIGSIIALIHSWKMGLVTIAITPLNALGTALMARLQFKRKAGGKHADEKS